MASTYIITITSGQKVIAILNCTVQEHVVRDFLIVKFVKSIVPDARALRLKSVLSTTKIPASQTDIAAIQKFLQGKLPKRMNAKVAAMKQTAKKQTKIASTPLKKVISKDNASLLKNALKHDALRSGSARLGETEPIIEFGSPREGFSFEPTTIFERSRLESPALNTISHEDIKTQQRSIQFEVMYVTTRDRITGAKSPGSYYGKKRGNEMDYGSCLVSVPEKREPGQLNRPGWLENIILGENKRKHFVLLSLNPCDKESFRGTLESKFTAYGRNDVLIFIHGFNNTFADSIRRAAQLGYDLNFQGPVIAFSWPSIGTTKGYGADIDSAADAGRLLETFLIDLDANTRCENIHIIAHSMGNVTLTEGLMNLRNSKLYPLSKIKQVILAAPDLDQTRFIQSIHPKLYHTSTPPRFTLYASTQDKALRLAQKIRAGYPRVGLAGDELVILDGIESIDASLVDTSELLEHSYFAGATTIIYDIRDVLRGLQPKDRVLDEKSRTVNGVKRTYWSLRRARP
jgi:esterase/lipase superfamily enzyme